MTELRATLVAAVLVSVLGTLSGCQVGAHGRADELHPEVRAFFEEYRRKVHRGAFALSVNGNSAGYNYCPKTGMCGVQRNDLFRSAIQSCRVHSDGVPCKIFAWRGNIIWEGAIPGSDQQSAGPLGSENWYTPAQRRTIEDDHKGRGTVTLSENVAKAYERFRKQDGAGYFAMPPTGAGYYFKICKISNRDFESCLEETLSKCQEYVGSACHIFADKHGIVWKGKVRTPGGDVLHAWNE